MALQQKLPSTAKASEQRTAQRRRASTPRGWTILAAALGCWLIVVLVAVVAWQVW